ncbi:hypothetical protein ACA910_006044 [Epithemia clementina (nom. ined.)]
MKEKRKGRLDKVGGSGTPTEFIGFGAFAGTTTSSPTQQAAIMTATTARPTSLLENSNSNSNSSKPSTVKSSPVYTGNNEALQLAFSRISQKRDGITKTKALQELANLFSTATATAGSDNNVTTNSSSTTTATDDSSTTISKWHVRVHALPHWMWLYANKLAFDITAVASVRATSLQVWQEALRKVPKAVVAILTDEVWGMLYAAQVDPFLEVRNEAQSTVQLANQVWKEQQEQQQPSEGEDIGGGGGGDTPPWYKGVLTYSNRILGYGRPSALQEALFAKKKGGSGSNNDSSSSNNEKEEAEERFSLLTGLVLDALCLLFQQQQLESSTTTTTTAAVQDDSNMTNYDNKDSPAILFRYMPSSVDGLRLRTYRLVSIVASSSNKNHRDLLPDAAISTLLQSLSSEKNPNAWSALLEAFLAVAVMANNNQTTNNNNGVSAGKDLLLPTNSWRKGLIKALRKACYGASVASWGPILLPLTSTLAFPPPRGGGGGYTQKDREEHLALALELIKAAWEGQHVTLGMTEAGRLAMAVAETAHVALLRTLPTTIISSSDDDEGNSDDDATTKTTTATIMEKDGSPMMEATKVTALAIAEIWLEVLENALTDQSLATGNARSAAWEPLLQNLAQQLQRYQDHQPPTASSSNSSSINGDTVATARNAFALIRKEFWAKVSLPCTHPEALAYFVSKLSPPPSPPLPQQDQTQHKKAMPEQQRICRVVQTCFQELLAPYQESSATLPSPALYPAMQALVDYEPAVMVTERFVMNDLLQWLILHTTSQASDYSNNNDDLVRADFRLLASSLIGNPEKAPVYWATVLKEILAAKPFLHALTLGIEILLLNGNSSSNSVPDWIQCSILDKFAMEIFTDSAKYPANEQLEFCQTVLGLTSRDDRKHPHPVVNKAVWESWIETYENSSADNKALAQILLQITKVSQAPELIDISKVESIVLQSWLQEQRRNPDDESSDDTLKSNYHYMEILQSNRELATRVVAKASTEMKRQVEENDMGVDDKNSVNTAADWGLRSWRLVEISRTTLADTVVPSLSLLGLDNAAEWSARPLKMYSLIMSLFAFMDDKDQRFKLLEIAENSVELFLCILVNICEASTDLTISARVSNGIDRCSVFLEALGASGRNDYLKDAFQSLLRKMVSALESADSSSSKEMARTQRLTTVLSALLRSAYPETIPTPKEPFLVPNAMRTGDQVWYITDPKSPNQMEPVTIAKVHFDTETGYYFTIQTDRDGQKSERQTIVDRLHKTNDCAQPSTSAPLQEAKQGSAMRDQIVSKILRSYFANASAECGLGDLLNTLVSRVGVGKERGIGSAHFDLFQLLTDENKRLLSDLQSKQYAKAQDSLWKLAQSFGFGQHSEPRNGTFLIFSLDPAPSHELIAGVYDSNGSVGRPGSLDRAVLAWLIVSLPSIRVSKENSSSVTRTLEMMFSLSRNVLMTTKGYGFTSDTLLALKALAAGRRFLANNPSLVDQQALRDNQTACFTAAIELFASDDWMVERASQDQTSSSVWKHYSDFPSLIEETCKTDCGRALLAQSITPSVAESLVHSLFSNPSRFYAFNMLDCVLGKGEVLRSDQEIALDESTTAHLKEWTQGMDSQGALELEEDVEIVSQWLPISMMKEIETWQDETFEDLNEEKTIGRLLAWLSVLSLIETSAPKDFRSRPAFVSYLTKAEAVPSVLNVSILFDETMNSTKSVQAPHVLDTDRILENEEMITISNLSSHVIFRTFETLPSLCRRWWEEDCPKVYTSRVQSLVERQIAPEILRREMRRMKEATKNFGDMNVSGSSMSREITATYKQDDFTLTVLIRLPASFPLRSAEVDCSRTLGVPPNRWKRWSLQITLMLNNQGGTLQDALMLWKENVDKEFDGVEPCPICYSVLQVKTHKLPSLECATCHNRFHADCLTQWFKQSAKNQCVLCQQDWRGVRV